MPAAFVTAATGRRHLPHRAHPNATWNEPSILGHNAPPGIKRSETKTRTIRSRIWMTLPCMNQPLSTTIAQKGSGSLSKALMTPSGWVTASCRRPCPCVRDTVGNSRPHIGSACSLPICSANHTPYLLSHLAAVLAHPLLCSDERASRKCVRLTGWKAQYPHALERIYAGIWSGIWSGIWLELSAG